MSPPSLFHKFRQIVGRALRETAQALDRVAVKTASLAVTKHDYYDDPVIFEDHLSRHRHQFPLLTAGRPQIHSDVAFLAPCSTLIGSVSVGKGSSIWYGAVVRGDNCENVESYRQNVSIEPWELKPDRLRDQTDHHGGAVFIGDDTNIQDGCVVTARINHTKIGNGVTVGHLAQIHSATVHDFSLIGMGSVLNDGVVVETECLIAAGAVIPPNTRVSEGELWVGNPARKLRSLSPEERERLHYQSDEYVKVATEHRHVMKLGGNVDANGASVYIVSDEDEEVEKLPVDEVLKQIESSSTEANDDVEEEPLKARAS